MTGLIPLQLCSRDYITDWNFEVQSGKLIENGMENFEILHAKTQFHKQNNKCLDIFRLLHIFHFFFIKCHHKNVSKLLFYTHFLGTYILKLLQKTTKYHRDFLNYNAYN